MSVCGPHPQELCLPASPPSCPASCPSWKTANGLARGLRARSQFPLSPGAADERRWGCCVPCYLSRGAQRWPRDMGHQAKGSKLRCPSEGFRGPRALGISNIASMWPRASSRSQRGPCPHRSKTAWCPAGPAASRRERQAGGAGGSAGWCWEGRSKLLDSGWRESRMT